MLRETLGAAMINSAGELPWLPKLRRITRGVARRRPTMKKISFERRTSWIAMASFPKLDAQMRNFIFGKLLYCSEFFATWKYMQSDQEF
jgi:hypothetical protein